MTNNQINNSEKMIKYFNEILKNIEFEDKEINEKKEEIINKCNILEEKNNKESDQIISN